MMLPGASLINKTGHRLKVHWNWSMQMKKSISKKVFTALLSLSLVLPPSSVVANSIPDEQFSLGGLNGNSGAELQGLLIQDDLETASNPSHLVASMDSSRTHEKKRICLSIDDEFCKVASAIDFSANLPVCSEKYKINCVESFSAKFTDSGSVTTAIEGTHQGQFPVVGRNDFEGLESRDLPTGASPGIWKLPGLVHGGGTDEYLVKFQLRGNANADQRFQFGSYDVTITPFTKKFGSFGRNWMTDGREYANVDCKKLNLPCGPAVRFASSQDFTPCAAVDDGACALKQAFPTDSTFKVVARLSQSPTGWLHGRVKSPDIQITQVSNYTKVSIEAEPVVVPVVGVIDSYASLPDPLKNFYSNPMGLNGSSSWGEPGPTGRRNILAQPSPDSENAFQALLNWSDYIKDKASASPTQWKIRTLNDQGSASYCFSGGNKLIGVVSTNSMVYLGGPPEFNSEVQSLDYKVASPHYTSKNEVFKGTYDLVMSSSVARCLYGFNSAPLKASIQIVNENGQNSVATTVISEKDGWLKLGAYGFTFSSPTLRVKLTQEKAAAKKKLTISCLKGKVTKKVTGTAPKCPSGYKKK
jgi:hypothetical protein